MDRERHECVGEPDDGREVGDGIVGHALEQRDVLGERRGGEQQRVAVRGRTRAATCVPMLPLAPGLFSTTTGWLQRRSYPVAHHACQDVGPRPWGERHDDGDGAARLLREGAAGCEGGRSDRGQQ